MIPPPGAAPSHAFQLRAVTRGRRQRATAPLERRSLAVPPPRDRSDRLPRYVGLRFNQRSAWAMKSAGLAIVSNRLLGDDGVRPEVGWVPLTMDEPPAPRFPWQLRGTLH
jgi:hypothetical protein